MIGTGTLPGEPVALHSLVTHDEQEASRRFLKIWEHRVGGPSREWKGRHEDRILDGAPPTSIAHIHNDDARLPFGRIRQAVVHPYIVHPRVRMVVFAHVPGIVDVPHVDDDVLVASR